MDNESDLQAKRYAHAKLALPVDRVTMVTAGNAKWGRECRVNKEAWSRGPGFGISLEGAILKKYKRLKLII